MAKNPQRNKKQIIRDFQTMKSFEESARNTYSEIASDPRLVEKHHRDTLNKIARDEQKHARLVQQMLDLINREL